MRSRAPINRDPAWLCALSAARAQRRVGVVEPKEPLAVDRLDRRAERVDFEARSTGRAKRRLADPFAAARRVNCRSAPGRTSHQSSTSPNRRNATPLGRVRSDKIDRIEPRRAGDHPGAAETVHRLDGPAFRKEIVLGERTPPAASPHVRLSTAGEFEYGRATTPMGEAQSC